MSGCLFYGVLAKSMLFSKCVMCKLLVFTSIGKSNEKSIFVNKHDSFMSKYDCNYLICVKINSQVVILENERNENRTAGKLVFELCDRSAGCALLNTSYELTKV